MAEQYKIELGVKLRDGDIQSQINDAQKTLKPIELKIDAETKELTNTIKEALNSLSKGTKNALTLDTSKLEASLSDVTSTIREIKTAMGTLDSGSNMKSLVSSINSISTALDKASDKFDGLITDLKSLSGKDFNLNFGINLGGSNSVARQGIYGSKVRNETLPQLKQQVSDLVKYYNTTYKESLNEFEALQKMVSGTKLNNGDFFEGFLYGKDSVASRMGSGSLSSQMQAYKAYIDMFKQAASLRGVDLSSVTSGFSKSADELIKDAQDVQTGAKEMEDSFEKLKQVFGGGNNLNIEGLSAAIEPIIKDLTAIREAIESLSKGVSLEGLTQSFDRLSDTIEKLVQNADLAKSVLGDGLSDAMSVNTSSISNIEKTSDAVTSAVVQSEKKKQQVYRETDDVIENLKTTLQTMNLDRSSIDAITKDVQELGFEITSASVKMQNGNFDITVKGVDSIGRAVTEIRHLDSATDEISGISRTISQSLKETDTFVKQQKQSVTNLTNQINQLNRAANDQNASRPIKDASHLDALESKYRDIISAIQRMENASSDTFVDEQNNVKALISDFKSLVKEYKNAENVSTKMKGTDFASGFDIAKNDLEKLKAQAKDFPQITQTIKNLDEAIEGVGDSASLNKFNDQLRVARSELARIKSETSASNRNEKVGINVSGLESKIADIQRISPEIDKFETEIDGAKVSVQSLLNDLKQVKTQGDFSVVNSRFKAFADAAKAAGIAVAEVAQKSKSIKDIKLDIELGTYDNQISQMDDKFNRLSNASNELRESVKQVHQAYAQMELALEGTGDEVADKERLIQAEKEYARALEKTNNLIRMQARADKINADKQRLIDDRQIFQSKIDAWLTKNSAATKQFGAAMLDLKAKAENCDRVDLNHLEKEFKQLDYAADKAGLKMQSALDRVKGKFKEYMAYFSVAEVFMWVEQSLREIFNTVKEIDTAMTGLYRVTDLTASQYDTLFNDMISSAKEYGATLKDIINATTDWVRAGFDADTALGLAEVTTMYQHISDLDYDTAAENLITAYNGFKDELNGAFNGDTVASVNYIADILNELDNNYAATSAGIGEALTRSASALDLAGNSIQETAGMITGIIEVTQDPEQAGSTLKILSLRLRGMKGQLEELGEETDENVENISKMQGQILNLTKGKVNIFDASGEFKSTYEIMKDISEVWDDLNSTAQADLLETIAGKHRANSVAALLSNWENVEAAVKSATEAEGSAAAENAKYVDSIQGRLDKLTTSWQSFANTFMNSDFLKGAVSGLTGLVEVIEKLVKSLGTFGTIGLGAGIFSMFKNKGLFKGILGDLGSFSQLATEVWMSGGKLSTRFKDIGKTAKIAGGSIAGRFTGSLSGMIGGIGLAIAAIGLLVNAYKNYREEISQARQEAIQSADEFLDSASSFERAYIKYSGKTNLTVEEEQELESAINGTVDALGDKSSALQNAVNSSNDYVASLERITKAELQAAEKAAKEKKENARLELEDAVHGWVESKVDVRIGEDSFVSGVAKDMNSKYLDENIVENNTHRGFSEEGVKFALDANATPNEILDYYYTLIEYKERLIDAAEEQGKTEDTVYKKTLEKVDGTITKMSELVIAYESGALDMAKASYKASEGIPKTTEEFLKMREAILRSEDIKGLSLDTKNSFANTLDSEYKQIFDLSSVEFQARKLVGVIKHYGDGTKDGTNEIGTVETFLNMRTAVNDNECSVGEYLAQFDEIDKIIKNWSDEEKELLNTTFGLDTDVIKQQYKDTFDYLSRFYRNKDTRKMDRDEEYDYKFKARENDKKVREFLDSLTASELAAVVDIRTEIDWENTSAEDIRKQIEDQVKLNEALSFTTDIEVDTTALEALNTALAESASAIGLSEESIDSLKAKYADLEGYNPHTLFEKTANGVKVNREELAKLEKKYNDLTKTEVQEHLDTLVEEYNKCTKAIDGNIGSQEKLELISKREKYAQQIEELAEYQAQLEGVTGAYQRWLDAQNTPEDYEGYELVATSREDIKDEIDRGFISNASKEYIDLLSGKDLQGGTIDDYANAWGKLDDKITGAGHSINDFFTVNDDGDITATGIDRFFKSVQTDFKGSIYKFNDETGKWYYDFSQENLQKIQDEWGIGIEAIELLLEAAASAGYDIDWGGIFDDLDLDTSNFESLVSIAEKAQEELNKLEGYEDLDFNFSTTTVEAATSELEKAQKTYNELVTNDDGTINLEAEGADNVRVILATLLVQKQQLEDSEIAINISTSGLDDSQAKAVAWVQDFRTKYKNLEIAISTGEGIEEAKTELETVKTSLGELDGDTAKIAAQLVLGEDTDTSGDGFKTQVNNAIDSIGKQDINVGFKLNETAISDLNSNLLSNFTVDATAKITGVDKSQLETVETGGMVNWTENTDGVSKSFEADGTVNWDDNVKNVKTSFSASGTVKWTSGNNVKVKVISEANGTANANGSANSGRAFAHGNWGIKGSGTALVGELGTETLVRQGKFYTIGDNGAEFIKYRPNDIIFNHKQTEELFKYGKVLSDGGRGRVYANGSAFAWGAVGQTSLFSEMRTSKKSKVKPKTETKTTAKDDSVEINTTVSGVNVNASGESDFVKEREGQTTTGTSSSTKDKFEDTIDWIEVILDRAERAIDKYEKQADNVYKTWAKRNKALEKEITEVGSTIDLYEQAKNQYLSEANGVGLDANYAAKVRNGTLDIQDFKGDADEKLVEKIKNYQDLYNKYLDCVDKIEELKEKEASLYAQRFENVQSEYENLLQGFDHTQSMLDEYISQAEAKGYIVSKEYYNALIDNEKDRIKTLKQEQSALIAKRDEAVAEGKITKESQAWYEQCEAIDEVTQAIEASNTAIIEFSNSIRDIERETFDLIQERISAITEETDFLIELMSNKKLFDEDSGQLTNEGKATMGLHGQNYNTYMYQADLVAKEAERLKKQLASDPHDIELEKCYREMIALQQEYILAAEDEKNAIRDLVEEGINYELDALQERIDLYNDALESQRDLYEYSKKVAEQTKEIASLEKQMAAYQGDNSEEAKAKIQELKVSLEEARDNLEETEYDKFISDTSALLDNLYLEYETILNERLDNLDYLVEQMIAEINADASVIGDTITQSANDVGYTLSQEMESIWNSSTTSINGVITMYGDQFSKAQTTTNTVLGNIKAGVDGMVASLNKEAEKKVVANKTTTSAKKDPTKNSNNKKPTTTPTQTNTNKSGGDGKANVGDKVKFVSGKYYYDSQGQKPVGSMYKGKEVYITNINKADWATHHFHISTGKKLGSGDLGWVKLSQLSGYATGKKNFSNDEIAWTQENGREFIVRPSDGAILTPVAKGDSVLTSAASSNIWNMANSPAEFIKDNLNLGSTSVPNNSTVQNSCIQNFDKIVFSMPNVKNYDEMLKAMQDDPNFERLVEAMSIGKLVGKSSLAKGKAIR